MRSNEPFVTGFGDAAFAAMLGYDEGTVRSHAFRDVSAESPPSTNAVSVLYDLVTLSDGTAIRVVTNRSPFDDTTTRSRSSPFETARDHRAVIPHLGGNLVSAVPGGNTWGTTQYLLSCC
jgi:hypothetical protein